MDSEKSNLAYKQEGLTLDFIAGLIDGDGSFNVSFQHKPTRRVRVNFTVVQETACKEVLNELKTYFGCGNVYDLPKNKNAACYQVNDINSILDRVIPMLNKVIFNTEKNQRYQTMVKVCEIIKLKGYELDENYIEIIELAYDQNKPGNGLPKEIFIQKMSVGGAYPPLFGNKTQLFSLTQKRTMSHSLMSHEQKSQSELNPNFISGFVDGEGSFYLGMSRDSERSNG